MTFTLMVKTESGVEIWEEVKQSNNKIITTYCRIADDYWIMVYPSLLAITDIEYVVLLENERRKNGTKEHEREKKTEAV